MKSLVFAAAVVVLVVVAAPGVAHAQWFASGHSDNPNGPTVSPYLNLLQNNSILGPPTNYQSLVRPLVDQNSAIQRQGASLSRLQQQVNSGGGGGAGNSGSRAGTGHASRFMNYSHYYPSARPGPGAR